MEVVAIAVGAAVAAFFYVRSKRDNHVSCVVNMIREMEAKGIEYWSQPESEPTSKSLAVDIKRLSKHIGFEVSRGLKLSQAKRSAVQKRLTSFRVTVTGGTFEQRDRQVEQARIDQINSLSISLISALRD